MRPLSPQARQDRKLCNRSLYYLCKEVLGYKDMVPHVHGDICDFITNPKHGRFRQATVPRSWFKTWVCTVGGSIWLTLPDEEGLWKDIYPWKGPDARILIASNVVDNAEKMIHKIRSEWMNNTRLKAAFPELIPAFNKIRWSNSCAELKRPGKFTEGTYTAVGAGGSVISQHFEHIIEDDLIYANKDDFTGKELMPNQEDIDKAIGWHKLTFSLFSHPQTSTMWNVGTRWAPHDLIDYIRSNEKHYVCFEIKVTKEGVWPIPNNDFCVWPERYDRTTLKKLRDSQTAHIFETQYLCRPRQASDVVFSTIYINTHNSLAEYPKGLNYRTYVDVASWNDRKNLARSVIITVGRDGHNHYWVARCDAGRYNPTEVIERMAAQAKQFQSKVLVEEYQYQKALRHFAKKYMEDSGNTFSCDAIPHEAQKNAKEMRIRGLEGYVRNGMIHVLESMTDLLEEFEDYPYGATKDILDMLGYSVKHTPKSYNTVDGESEDPFSLEAIISGVKKGKDTYQNVFSDPLADVDYQSNDRFVI
jgi:predicted phage terminase large subunit-like protein